MAKLKFCTKCGSRLQNEDPFCGECGSKMVDGDISPNATPEQQVPIPPQQTTAPQQQSTVAQTDKANITSILFSFEGRIPRKTLWLSIIPLCLILILFMVISGGNITIMLLGALCVSWSSFALTVKRWHDLNKSGWYVIFNSIPIVNIWALIQCGFVKGTTGANNYGPDPLQIRPIESGVTSRGTATIGKPLTVEPITSEQQQVRSTKVEIQEPVLQKSTTAVTSQEDKDAGLSADKYCDKCGKEIISGDIFCRSCGARKNQESLIPASGITYSSEREVKSIPEIKEIGSKSAKVFKPNMAVVIIAVIVLLAAGWYFTLSKSSKNQNNIAQSNVSPASPVSGSAKFDSFKQYVGKYADDINFYAMLDVKSGMTKTFGTQSKHMINNLSVASPMKLEDNCLVVSGNAPHMGGSEDGIMLFDLQTGMVSGAILSENARSRNSKIDVYTYATEPSTMPAALRRWLDEHKSSSNQPAKYHYIKSEDMVPASATGTATPRVEYGSDGRMIAFYGVNDGTHGNLDKYEGTISSVRYNKKYHNANLTVRAGKYDESFDLGTENMTARDESRLRQDILAKGNKVSIDSYSEGSGGFKTVVNIKVDPSSRVKSSGGSGQKKFQFRFSMGNKP